LWRDRARIGAIDHPLKQATQRLVVTAQRGAAGGDVLPGVHKRPPDVMTGLTRKLGAERPLGPAISIPERMQRVQVGQ
jgi:hypothetical protein